MHVTGLNHVNLVVASAELEILRSFYCEVLGLTVGPRPPFERKGYCLYAGERDVLHLTESMKAQERQLAEGGSSFDHFAFQGEDLVEAEEVLNRLGIPYTKAQVPGLPRVQWFLLDPLGQGVELEFVADEAFLHGSREKVRNELGSDF